MIPTSWQKTSDLTWKGVDDACARVLVSTQPDCKTVRGYTVEVSGPLRETREEAVADAERAIWAFEKASDREGLARAIYAVWEQQSCVASWDKLPDSLKAKWLAMADAAIRMVPTMASGELDRVKALAARLEKLLDRVHASVDYEDRIDQTDTDLIEHLDGIMARLEMAERMVLDAPKAPAADREALARHLYNTLMKGLTGAQDIPFDGMTEVRQDAWLAVADEALRATNVDASDNDAWPPGWQGFGDEYVWTSGHSYAENPRVPASPRGRLAARILSGQQVLVEDARELRFQLDQTTRKLAEAEKERDRWRATAKAIDADLTFNVNIRDRLLSASGYTGTDLEAGVRHVADLKSEVKIAGDRLAVVGRKVAQVEKDRAEDQREIRIAHETLDTANVPRMAGTLSDRIRRLDERLNLERTEKHLARGQRDELRVSLKRTEAALDEAIEDRDLAIRNRLAFDGALESAGAALDEAGVPRGTFGLEHRVRTLMHWKEDLAREKRHLQSEIANANNALDEIGVCSANHLADRVRHLESLRKSCETSEAAATSKRNDFERRWSDEVQAHLATRAERDILKREATHANARREISHSYANDLEALLTKVTTERDLANEELTKITIDYEAKIGALEAINERKTSALALLSFELAEALGAKKVTS